MSALELDNVDIVFGEKPNRAFRLIDEGADQERIRHELNLTVAAIKASLVIERNEIFVLMGLSGSGKSTLLRAFNGLCKPTRGGVRINNSDLTTMGKAQVHALRTQSVSMVFQNAGLLPWKTALENVAFGLELQGINKRDIQERSLKALQLVGLEQWADQKPSELSGGMRQRVGIARALATETDIILMDEPFSALDPLIRRQLQDEIIRLQKELKKTIVFVSHDLEEAARIASRIAILERGRIVQIGTPAEIVSRPANDYVKRFVAGLERSCPRCDSVMSAKTGI